MVSATQIISESAEILSSGSLSDKLRVLYLLGCSGDRRAYPVLADALHDKTLRPTAVSAFTELKDSRSLFPLINLFGLCPDEPQVQQRIMQYFFHTKDPRAAEFLEEYLASEGREEESFADIARSALEACRGNTRFLYRYSGSEDDYAHALASPGGMHVSNTHLSSAREVLSENQSGFGYERPQTYVIPANEKLLIGGVVNEHVAVARGRDVLAAGEIIFQEVQQGSWSVTSINNRSNGYFPSPTCFFWVRNFFEKNDVHFDKERFDAEFPPYGFNDADFLSVFMFGEHY